VTPTHRHILKFAVLVFVEAIVAAWFLPDDLGFPTVWGHSQPWGVVRAAPVAIGAHRAALALVVCSRRAATHRWRVPVPLIAEVLVASLACAIADASSPSGFHEPRYVIAWCACAGSAAIAFARSFDVLHANDGSRARRALFVATIASLVFLFRSRASAELIAFASREPPIRTSGVAAWGVLLAVGALHFVRARSNEVHGEPDARVVQALSSALGFLVFFAWTSFVITDPYVTLREGPVVAWIVPLGWLGLVIGVLPLIAPLGWRHAFVLSASTVGAWLVAYVALIAVDRSFPSRTWSPSAPVEDSRVLPLRADRAYELEWTSGLRTTRRRRSEDGLPRVHFVVSRIPGDRSDECDARHVARRFVEYAILHPGAPPVREVALWIDRRASDARFAECIVALDAAGARTVALLGRFPVPLPAWSALHVYAREHTPVGTVALGPLESLRCESPTDARCTAQGVVAFHELASRLVRHDLR